MKKSHRTRALALDFGRVLTLDPDHSTFIPHLSSLGIEPQLFQSAYSARRHELDRGHWDAPRYWNEVLRACNPNLEPRTIDALVPALVDADFLTWGRPREAMHQVVKQSIARGTQTAIVSNMPQGVGPRYVKAWPWLEQVPHRFFSADLGLAKPEPEFYQHVLRQTGWDPVETLFVDDVEANIEGAARAGFQVLLFTGSDHDLEVVARW